MIEAARGREVEPILPSVVGTRADHRVLLPWDDGYEDAAADIGSLPPDASLASGNGSRPACQGPGW